ncbi:MAG: type II toxin-antitoxin system RelE/ParE family toxin [Pasteurella sp.]|nr:type II toxin-antitoxin system RelE/ParE family toxin [Pasteurella sp.]MBS9783026.1 type II toxin-antitoxin system RelE/ParE family toxin [Pasteurella sp.]
MKIIFSNKANNTLVDIFEYIATEYNMESAERIVNEIIDGTIILEQFPKIGRIFKGENIRFLMIGKYVAVYYIDIKNDHIIITEIYTAGQNWR